MPKVAPKVQAALQLAVEAHRDQSRKDGRTPYIVHPVGVMRRLSCHLSVTDPEMLAASLLHDVLEDTDTPAEALRSACGDRVLGLVLELTLPDDVHGPKVPTSVKTHHLTEALARISWEGVVIKLCDRWDNLGDMFAAPWTPQKSREFLEQTEAMLATVRQRASKDPPPAPLGIPLEKALAGVQATLAEARATFGRA